MPASVAVICPTGNDLWGNRSMVILTDHICQRAFRPPLRSGQPGDFDTRCATLSGRLRLLFRCVGEPAISLSRLISPANRARAVLLCVAVPPRGDVRRSQYAQSIFHRHPCCPEKRLKGDGLLGPPQEQAVSVACFQPNTMTEPMNRSASITTKEPNTWERPFFPPLYPAKR